MKLPILVEKNNVIYRYSDIAEALSTIEPTSLAIDRCRVFDICGNHYQLELQKVRGGLGQRIARRLLRRGVGDRRIVVKECVAPEASESFSVRSRVIDFIVRRDRTTECLTDQPLEMLLNRLSA